VKSEAFINLLAVMCFSLELMAEPCTSHIAVAWKEVRKQGNVEHMVVPYVALWNIGFQ
jgi:hypothetical protein